MKQELYEKWQGGDIYNCTKFALKKCLYFFEEVSFVKKMLMNACLIPVKMEEPA